MGVSTFGIVVDSQEIIILVDSLDSMELFVADHFPLGLLMTHDLLHHSDLQAALRQLSIARCAVRLGVTMVVIVVIFSYFISSHDKMGWSSSLHFIIMRTI